MQVIISGRRVVLSPAFRATAGRKIEKLVRVLPRILDVRLVCAQEKLQRSVRLTVRAGRRVFSTRSTGPDFLAAVDDAIETLGRQAREEKERRTRRRERGLDLIEPVA